MAKYRKRFRNGSARLKGWDYRNPSAYFITICTHNRQHFFGECTHGTMKLSTMGAIVQGFWYEIPKFSPHVQLGAFVVMPDHLHGILILTDRPPIKKTTDNVGLRRDVGTWQCHVPTSRRAHNFYSHITPKPGSVSTIIGSYKSACTKHIRRAFPEIDFRWQERFYDHIIRNEKSFHRISQYILNNPKNWKKG
jgi:putative transposase